MAICGANMKIFNITKKYDEKTVVDSVSFEIPQGKVVSFIGPNGAGKSTVMGMISRLIARDSGMVEFKGKDIKDWKDKDLAKELAILTQQNNIQMKLTVEELVCFGRFPHSGNHLTQKDMELVNQAISYMELEDFRDRFLDELSGGQRQRDHHPRFRHPGRNRRPGVLLCPQARRGYVPDAGELASVCRHCGNGNTVRRTA